MGARYIIDIKIS